MVLFATVPISPQGFFIGVGQSMGWRNLPHDLADEIEDARDKGESVLNVSVGVDGDWFIRTEVRHSAKNHSEESGLVSNVELFLQIAENSGLDLSLYTIESFAFVPDPAGYVSIMKRVDGLTRCAWRNVPASLDRHLEVVASRGIKSVAVGQGGSWVVVQNDGTVNWRDVPQALANILKSSSYKGIQSVSLSLTAHNYYFINYAGGSSTFSLPTTWHPIVESYRHMSPTISPTASSYSPPAYPSLDFSRNFYSPPPAQIYNVYQNPDMNQQSGAGVQIFAGVLKVTAAVLPPLLSGGMIPGFS